MLQKKTETERRKLSPVAVFAMLVLFLVVAELFWKHISFSATNSVGYHLFYISYHPTEIRRGEYILFRINPNRIAVSEVRKELGRFGTHLLVKQIACVPGDRLEVRGNRFYCNGRYLCRAKDKALDGEGLTHFIYNGIVPNNNFFAYGKDNNSFDSRYFGFVKKNEILGIAYPIF